MLNYIRFILILLIILAISFFSGIFHPHKIYIDDIEINVPYNMYLFSAVVERENVQNLFSPLILNNKYDYTFPKLFHGETKLYFSSTLKIFNKNLLHIILDPIIKNELIFKNSILNSIDIDNYERIKSSECIIYFKNKNISIAEIFIHDKNISIMIASDDNSQVYKNIIKFCKDIK